MAGVINACREQNLDCNFFGMGGRYLRNAGMETVVDSETSASVMGLTEVLGSLKTIIGAFNFLLKEVDSRKPKFAILVDYPDFNLRLAKRLKKRGIKVLYFIPPQLWAWRTGRIKQIKKYVDQVVSIIPFEEKFYKNHGVDAEYVGHPFLEGDSFDKTKFNRESFLKGIGLDSSRPVLGLLPGSRKSEIKELYDVLIESFQRMSSIRPGIQAVIPVAPNLSLDFLQKRLSGIENIVAIPAQAREVLMAVDVSVVASGTVTVEAAVAGNPFIVIYKLKPLTYFFAKRLVTGVKHFAMANLIAGESVVPELLQDQVNAEEISYEIERYLGDPQRIAETKRKLNLVTENLKNSRSQLTASQRTAEIIGKMLQTES